MSGAPFKKLPASQSVSSPSVPVADRGGEEVNVDFCDFGAGSGNQGRYVLQCGRKKRLIRERTGAGREAAKKRGVQFGRPRKLALDQNELAQRLVSEGNSVREIASVFNVHPATIYRLAATW